MRKWILLLAIIQFSFSSEAQFRLGASIGLNFSNLALDNADEFQTSGLLTKFTHLQLGKGITDRLNFNLQLGLGGKGGTMQSSLFGSVSTSWRVWGLDVMPSLEFRPIKAIGLGAGAYGSLKFAEFIREEGGIWNATNGNIFESLNYGLHTYVQGYFKFLFVQIGYDHGLRDVLDINLTDQNGQAIGIATGQFREVKVAIGALFEL